MNTFMLPVTKCLVDESKAWYNAKWKTVQDQISEQRMQFNPLNLTAPITSICDTYEPGYSPSIAKVYPLLGSLRLVVACV